MKNLGNTFLKTVMDDFSLKAFVRLLVYAMEEEEEEEELLSSWQLIYFYADNTRKIIPATIIAILVLLASNSVIPLTYYPSIMCSQSRQNINIRSEILVLNDFPQVITGR